MTHAPLIHVTAPAVPGPAEKSGRWLDVARLRADIRALEAVGAALKARTTYLRQDREPTRDADRTYRANAAKLTQLYTLRALHRGRRHAFRRRVFGPGYPNGTALVDAPPRVLTSLWAQYSTVRCV